MRRNQWGDQKVFNRSGQSEVVVDIILAEPEALALTVLPPPSTGRGLDSLRVDQNDAVALVEWGAGGAPAQANVDVGLGFRMPVFAKSLRCTILLPNIVTVAGAPALVLGALAGKGDAPNTMLTRTITYSDIAALANEARAIPPFAKRVHVSYNLNVVTQSARYTFENAAFGTPQGDYFTAASAAIPYPPAGIAGPGLAVPPQASSLRIASTGAVGFTEVRAIYELAL